jgi:hypothetical protein
VSPILLDVLAQPDKPKSPRLVMADDTISIDGTQLTWAEIDRVAYSAVDHYTNGMYQYTRFAVAAGSGARKATFNLTSSTKGLIKGGIDTQQRDRNREQWTRAVEILEERACVRLIGEAVTTVLQGGTIEVAGLRLDPDGIHQGKVFRKSVRWSEVAGTREKHPYLWVQARRGEKTKSALMIMNGIYNAVLVPRVVSSLAARMNRG